MQAHRPNRTRVDPGRPPTPHLIGSGPTPGPQSCFFIVIPSHKGTRGDTREDRRGHSRENNMWTSDGSERGARKEQLMGQQGDKGGGCAAGPQPPPTPSNAKPKPHLSSNRASVDQAGRPDRTSVDASRPPKPHPRGSRQTAHSAPDWIQADPRTAVVLFPCYSFTSGDQGGHE